MASTTRPPPSGVSSSLSGSPKRSVRSTFAKACHSISSTPLMLTECHVANGSSDFASASASAGVATNRSEYTSAFGGLVDGRVVHHHRGRLAERLHEGIAELELLALDGLGRHLRFLGRVLVVGRLVALGDDND